MSVETMVGVSKEERALSRVAFAVRQGLPWLEINLATAFLAAFTVGLFEGTIAKYTALAILLPVVAGQSRDKCLQAPPVPQPGPPLRGGRRAAVPRPSRRARGRGRPTRAAPH